MFKGSCQIQTIMLGIQPLLFGMGTFGQMEVHSVSPLELTVSYLQVSNLNSQIGSFPQGRNIKIYKNIRTHHLVSCLEKETFREKHRWRISNKREPEGPPVLV